MSPEILKQRANESLVAHWFHASDSRADLRFKKEIVESCSSLRKTIENSKDSNLFDDTEPSKNSTEIGKICSFLLNKMPNRFVYYAMLKVKTAFEHLEMDSKFARLEKGPFGISIAQFCGIDRY